MAGTRLTASERELFVALDRVIYGNPFSDTQAQIIQRLVPSAVNTELRIDWDALWPMVEPQRRTHIDVAAMPVCVLGFDSGETRTAPKSTLDAYAQDHGDQRP